MRSIRRSGARPPSARPAKDKGITAGPLLILAGAGTGKTNTLAHRTAHLVLNGVDPARILMLTFTRRAAQEMIRRTQTIVTEVMSDRGKLGDRSVQSRLLWSGTFHSVGNRILRQFAKHLGLDPNFTVLDRADAADLMDVIRHDLGYSSKDKRFPRKDSCLSIYSYRINTRLSLKQTLEEQFPWVSEWEQDLTRMYREYVARKQKNNVLDFDDLLLYWHAMMKNPALAQNLSNNFDHVLVDEYQDTSALQGEIINALKPDGSGVTVVGDDAQAIYSFRAAAVENILGFADRYKPKADMVVLAQNYRSTQQVLDVRQRAHVGRRAPAPQDAARHAPIHSEAALRHLGRRRWPGGIHRRQDSGDARDRRLVEAPCHLVSQLAPQRCARSGADQAQHSLCEVRRAEVSRGCARQGHAVGAALGRQSAQCRRRVPRVETRPRHRSRSRQAGARAFRGAGLTASRVWPAFDAPQPNKMDWKRFCALLEKLADPEHSLAGSGRAGARMVQAAAGANLRCRIQPHRRSRTARATYPRSTPAASDFSPNSPWIRRRSPAIKSGAASKDEDYVILSTIHSAKGQEWDIVYVLNVADGNFPSEFSTGKPEMIEEERRLLYVAMTRARNELHLCAPLQVRGHAAGQRTAMPTSTAPRAAS